MSRSKINKVIIGKRPEKRSANSQNDIKRKCTRYDSRIFLFGYLWTFIIVIFLGKFNVFFFVHVRQLPPSKTVLNKRSHPAIYISLQNINSVTASFVRGLYLIALCFIRNMSTRLKAKNVTSLFGKLPTSKTPCRFSSEKSFQVIIQPLYLQYFSCMVTNLLLV